MHRYVLALACLLFATGAAQAADTSPGPAGDTVVLLHGLARTSRAMDDMAAALRAAGYTVCNIDYPSRTLPVERLAREQVLPAIHACVGAGPHRVDFVTHSLGGILVRELRAGHADLVFGRVVMLGPPNGGSEVVDALAGFAPLRRAFGPAFTQLGTGAGSLPLALGPTDLEVGIIAGRHTIDPVSSLLIPGDDDGKVAVEKTKLAGMRDFLVVPVSHPFLMNDGEVIRQTIAFLRTGAFSAPPGPRPPPAPGR